MFIILSIFVWDNLCNNDFTNKFALYKTGETPRRGQKPVDSYSRLFGEPARPITPSKNHMKSNIPFGQNPNTAPLISKGNYNGKSGSVSSASSSVSSSTENLKINGGVRSGMICS